MSNRMRGRQETGHSSGMRPPTPLVRGPLLPAAAFRTETFPGPRFNPAALITPWRINIVNKDSKDDLLGTLRAVLEAHPGSDVCVHYSLKNNYAGSVAAAADRLAAFLPAAAAAGARSVLLVSGGGARRAFDSLAALRQLSKMTNPTSGASPPARGALQALAPASSSSAVGKSSSSSNRGNGVGNKTAAARSAAAAAAAGGGGGWPPLYVAFNPYLPDAAAAAEEARRLREKVATGLVAGVYLQMGDDIGRLEAGLKLLAELRATTPGAGKGTEQQTTQPQQQHTKQQLEQQGKEQQEQQQQQQEEECNGAPLPVIGSVFLPTPSFLARMRFRPWAGVHLSKGYLKDVAGAEAATRRLLKTYAAHGVVPIIETEIKRPEEASWIYSMLSEAYGPQGLENLAAAAAAAGGGGGAAPAGAGSSSAAAATAGKTPREAGTGAPRQTAAAASASPAPGPKRRRVAKQ